MKPPRPPIIAPLDHISPSLYESSLACPARGFFSALGERGAVPQHPKSLLGTSFHSVIAAARTGFLTDDPGRVKAAARELFDRSVQASFDEAHLLLRLKFKLAERLPFYNGIRERAAVHAEGVWTPPSGRTGAGSRRTEARLSSNDGKIIGRPDFIDEAASEVVDYKTGGAQEDAGDGVSDSEARQIRLYVHLSRENGIELARGAIVRGDGRRCVLEVSQASAEEEGVKARQVLSELNSLAAAGGSFEEAASPSADACRGCPCIPFCGAFWTRAEPAWAKAVGQHIEARVHEVRSRRLQGVDLLGMEVEVLRGSCLRVSASIEHLPLDWTTLGGVSPPATGSLVRVVGARVEGENPPLVVRVDRTTTSVWSPVE